MTVPTSGHLPERPLEGRKIVVTRAEAQAGEFSAKLRAAGAEVIEFPVIEIRPAADPGPLDAAIARLEEYDWLIFTSANGVKYFLERLDRSPKDLRSLRARLCAIGPATRAAIEALHLKVDLMPAAFVAESLVEAFENIDLNGRKVLLPRAAAARDVAPVELAKRGAVVEVVEAYRTVAPEGGTERAQALFGTGSKPDWVTLTSSSTVRNLLAITGAELLRGVRLASIGPVTTATLREFGLEPAVEARHYTTDGLLEAMIAYERQQA